MTAAPWAKPLSTILVFEQFCAMDTTCGPRPDALHAGRPLVTGGVVHRVDIVAVGGVARERVDEARPVGPTPGASPAPRANTT